MKTYIFLCITFLITVFASVIFTFLFSLFLGGDAFAVFSGFVFVRLCILSIIGTPFIYLWSRKDLEKLGEIYEGDHK